MDLSRQANFWRIKSNNVATEQNLWHSFHGGIKDGEFSEVTDTKDTWNFVWNCQMGGDRIMPQANETVGNSSYIVNHV